MIPTEVMAYARRVLGSVRRVRLSDVPAFDILDRVGLLTVVAGLRNVSAFGFVDRNNESRLTTLQKILTDQGLCCLITTPIERASNEPLTDEIGELFKVFDRVDAESQTPSSEKLLWVFRELGQEERIRQAVKREVSVGKILGYPTCCVEHHELVLARAKRVYSMAIVAAVGSDASAVERAYRDGLKVQLSEDPTDNEHMLRTDERFPFVMHTACDACLSSDDSPTARLDVDYGGLARQFDRRFHQLFLEMAKVRVRMDRLMAEAESKGLQPAHLGEPLRTQLAVLQHEEARIYSRFFEA